MSSISRPSVSDIFLVFLRLGCTSFGGPVAHIGYFREEFVSRRRWLDEQTYADLVALGQFLPGPASSQVGFALGVLRGNGLAGGVAAWLAFTMPSALILLAFGLAASALTGPLAEAVVHGLKLVAVAIVAHAIWGMAKSLTPDRQRMAIALAAVAIALFVGGSFGQVAAIAIGALAGLWLCSADPGPSAERLRFPVSRRQGATALALCAGLFILSPLAFQSTGNHALGLFDAFYRAGGLVFGGGHVVLPLLQAEVVGPGWVGREIFIAGYGAAQAMPGPLFTIASYLGMMMGGSVGAGLYGALLVTVAIFLPAGLLMWGALPFWSSLRAHPKAQSVLMGVNAAVVGLLLAALYDPVFTTAVTGARDLAAALVCYAALQFWKAPPWAVVVLAGLVGAVLYSL